MENIVIPLIAATMEFNKQNIIIKLWWIKNVKIIIGIIFCKVIKINTNIHSIPSTIEIIQKWNGNIPNFIKIETNMKIKRVSFIFSILKDKDIKKILEEILWIKK